MFTKPRYLVVDNDQSQLDPLVGVLQGLNAPCVGIRYDKDMGLDDNCFDGVRILFIDLHLTEEAGSSEKSYGVIVGLLEQCINPVSGPYLLVLWTKHEKETDSFREYVETNIAKGYCPLSILGLSKTKYMNPSLTAANGEIYTKIGDVIASNPQLNALINWEHAVLEAAGRTLSEICNLVPEEVKNIDDFGENLDLILSNLASAASGSLASVDKRASVSSALAPVLSDRIIHLSSSDDVRKVWDAAVTKTGEKNKVTPEISRHLNSLIHFAYPSDEKISPDEWGSIVVPPDSFLTDDNTKALLEHTNKELYESIFALNEGFAKDKGQLCFLRSGAICDAIQRRSGPIPLKLCIAVPMEGLKKSGKLSPAQYSIPNCVFPKMDGGSQLIVSRIEIHLLRAEFSEWEVLCRLREQIMFEVNSYMSNYVSRPGRLRF